MVLSDGVAGAGGVSFVCVFWHFLSAMQRTPVSGERLFRKAAMLRLGRRSRRLSLKICHQLNSHEVRRLFTTTTALC